MKLKLSALALLLASANLSAQTEVRLAVHKSFSLPQSVIAQFEKANDAKVSVIKAGSGNEMLNKLILSKANPIADAVYGLDNANIGKAREAGILAAVQPKSAPVSAGMPVIAAVNYGYVTLNYDKKWFEQKKLPLPKTLQDLTRPEYKNLLVTPSPATSSPGLAFLMANIGGMGEAFRIAKEELEQDMAHYRKLRDIFLKGIEGIEEVYINGDLEHRAPNNLNVSFNFVEGESLIMAVKELAVSSGSACTSASLEPSYVLRALGRNDELAHSSLRITFGRMTTEEEVQFAAELIKSKIGKLRELSPLWEMFKDGIDLNSIEWAAH